MFQWESYVSLGVLIIVIIVPRSVFTKSSSIKLYKEDKRLLVNSDPWPPAEQKLEMPCDNSSEKPQLISRLLTRGYKLCLHVNVITGIPPANLTMKYFRVNTN